MPGKKAHHPRESKDTPAPSHVKPIEHPNRKSTGETNGQFEHNSEHRKGEFNGGGPNKR
jgi:hypothetical protein